MEDLKQLDYQKSTSSEEMKFIFKSTVMLFCYFHMKSYGKYSLKALMNFRMILWIQEENKDRIKKGKVSNVFIRYKYLYFCNKKKT